MKHMTIIRSHSVHALRRPGRTRAVRRGGYSLIELLPALIIAAVLGLAIAAATSASFHAYGTSMEEANMQNSGRMVLNRVMTLIRTSALHDAYDPDNLALTLVPPSDSNHPLETVGIAFQTPEGQVMRIWWQENTTYGAQNAGDVMLDVNGGAAAVLIGRVTAQTTVSGEPYIFTLASRNSDAGLLLLRATLDLQIEPDPATVTPLEDATGAVAPLRLVASTTPRKNID
jgi:hypothetical protein